MYTVLVLRYACIDPEVGYCQGMGFIAGLLLTYMSEDVAFYAFTALMQHRLGPLRLLYLPGLVDAKRKLFVLDALGQQYLPRLWQHFQSQGIDVSMFAAEWVMTIFCRAFGFDLVTRVIDIYTLLGFSIIYRVSLAILKVSFYGIKVFRLLQNCTFRFVVVT